MDVEYYGPTELVEREERYLYLVILSGEKLKPTAILRRGKSIQYSVLLPKSRLGECSENSGQMSFHYLISCRIVIKCFGLLVYNMFYVFESSVYARLAFLGVSRGLGQNLRRSCRLGTQQDNTQLARTREQ